MKLFFLFITVFITFRRVIYLFILKIERLRKIQNLLSSLVDFFTCISKRRSVKVNRSILSADQAGKKVARARRAILVISHFLCKISYPTFGGQQY